MSKNYCVYKVSPSGIQKPLYYGSEEDCRRFCEAKDYEFIDDENVVWYLEIDSKPALSGNHTRQNESAPGHEQQELAGAGII